MGAHAQEQGTRWLLLMDQKAVAGIGNIYRAEILYKVRPPLLILAVLGSCARTLTVKRHAWLAPAT